MPKFMQHFYYSHRGKHVDPVMRAKKLVKRWQTSNKLVELHHHQGEGTDRKQANTNHGYPGKEPAGVNRHTVQYAFRINASPTHGKHIGQAAQPLTPCFLVATGL